MELVASTANQMAASADNCDMLLTVVAAPTEPQPSSLGGPGTDAGPGAGAGAGSAGVGAGWPSASSSSCISSSSAFQAPSS